MTFRGTRARLTAATLALFLISPGLAPLTRAADDAPAQPAAAPQSVAQLADNAWTLASDGHLDAVWQSVRTLSTTPSAAAPDADAPESLASLNHDLTTFEANQKKQHEKTHAAFVKKMDKLKEQLKSDDLRDALTTAIEAHDLADDPAALLKDPQITGLVTKAETEAAAQEKDGQWLKALSLYNALDMLFENQRKYTDHVKRVGRHVALLRLYAPEALFEQYKKEAAEHGDPAPEPWNFDEDRWQRKLEGITMPMLTEALALAAQRHVEHSQNYEDLLIGGIDALKYMFNTPGLEKTFPSLGDKAKVGKFVDYLDTLRVSLARRTAPMGRGEAAGVIARLMQQNAATVALPDQVVIHEVGDGAMDRLDQFSIFIWPYQVQRFERTTKGKFTGVGIQITQIARQLTVVTPLEDSPAQKAGIKAGDQIVTVDGKATLGLDLDSAVDKITGPEGTKVTLGIKTPGKKDVRDVTLTRSAIHVVTVKGWQREPGGDWSYYIDPKLKIGYVRLTEFGPDTASELDAAVQQMKGKGGIHGLIIDLRFNPGGLLNAAVDIVNRFINSGTIVSTTQTLLTGQPWSVSADTLHTYDDFPIVVLINRGSASASEITSGALQDHKRALILGERSYGKGSVQYLFRIGDDDNAYLKLTTQYYRIPSGRIIHRRPGVTNWGIHPDVKVRMTDQQVADELEARLLLDVLTEKGEKVDPATILGRTKSSPDGSPAKDDDAAKLPDVKTAHDILTHGLDPQLETALLLLKTRLLAPHT